MVRIALLAPLLLGACLRGDAGCQTYALVRQERPPLQDDAYGRYEAFEDTAMHGACRG